MLSFLALMLSSFLVLMGSFRFTSVSAGHQFHSVLHLFDVIDFSSSIVMIVRSVIRFVGHFSNYNEEKYNKDRAWIL
jgi:hypothetical protein